jgi:hypothetical protein
MKVYFTSEEMHTPEYKEYVKWVSDVWRMNDERNKRIEKEKLDLIERSRPAVSEKTHDQARELAKRLFKERPRKDTFWTV